MLILLWFHVSVSLQQFRLYNNFLQPFPTTISYNHSLQPFPTTIPYNHSLQPFPTTIPYNHLGYTTIHYNHSLQPVPTTIPYNHSLRPFRLYKNSLQPFPTTIPYNRLTEQLWISIDPSYRLGSSSSVQLYAQQLRHWNYTVVGARSGRGQVKQVTLEHMQNVPASELCYINM